MPDSVPPGPDDGSSRPDRPQDLLILIGVSVFCRALFLWFKDPRAISYDLEAWGEVARLLAAGQNPYLATPFLSWPPLWMQIVFLLSKAAAFLGISVTLAVQTFLIGVEVMILVATYRLIRMLGYPRPRTILLLGISLNPICILLVCQHGNFDVLVGLLIVLSLLALLRFQETHRQEDWLLACLWLGVGVALKLVPIVVAPLLLAGIRRVALRGRAIGAFLIAGPAIYGTSVLYALNPEPITQKVILYRSRPWRFGVTGMLHALRLDQWVSRYSWIFAFGMILLLIWIARRITNSSGVTQRKIVLLTLLLLAVIPFAGPGYGPQYLYWFWPLVLAAFAVGPRRLRVAIGVFFAVALATYLFEYAFKESLGAFFLPALPSAASLAVRLRSPEITTLTRAPLFLAYAAMLSLLAIETRRETTRD